MFTIQERQILIDLLSGHDMNNVINNHYTLKGLIMNGFKGYAGMSDKEIYRIANARANDNNSSYHYEYKNFIGNLCIDRMMLNEL